MKAIKRKASSCIAVKTTKLNKNLTCQKATIVHNLKACKSQKQVFLKLHCLKNERNIRQNTLFSKNVPNFCRLCSSEVASSKS